MSYIGPTVSECSQNCISAGSGLTADDCNSLCTQVTQCTDNQCFKDVEAAIVPLCVKACNESGKGLSANSCTSYCTKVSQCIDAQCIANAASEAMASNMAVVSSTAAAIASNTAVTSNLAPSSNTTTSGSPAITINIGLALIFVLISMYLINFRKINLL